jgi:hypothetical protein
MLAASSLLFECLLMRDAPRIQKAELVPRMLVIGINRPCASQ